MEYMLMTYESQEAFASRQGAKKNQYWGAWQAYTTALREAGVLRSGNALETASTATTVKIKPDGHRIQDGPFADSKEQLGGYYIIEVPNLDVALEWAARCPAATDGGVEVRPVLNVMG
jgi:hypothetical protein